MFTLKSLIFRKPSRKPHLFGAMIVCLDRVISIVVEHVLKPKSNFDSTQIVLERPFYIGALTLDYIE